MDASIRDILYQELQSVLGDTSVVLHAPMRRYTTLRLGGPAEIFCEPSTPEALASIFSLAKRYAAPITLIGNGSNLLVRDGGIPGVVVRIMSAMNHISAPYPLPSGLFTLTAEAGATLTRLSHIAAEHQLTGLEFAAGIPGTVGGAVYMNAGAYGGEMKDVVSSVTAMNTQGDLLEWTNAGMAFGYRQSRLVHSREQAALLRVTFTLSKGNSQTIQTTMRDFLTRRREKQPLTLPSCGSTFKRPPGQFAGTLIQDCGLKGFRIGGSCVSQLHAGFLVNDQEGTAADYLALIAHVQQTVLANTGTLLEPEVQILGTDSPLAAL